MSDQIVAEDVWAADMLYGSEPSSAPPTESNDDVVAESARASAGSGVRGESFELESALRHEPEADVNAGAKRTAIALGAGVACAVAVTAAVLMTFRDTAPAPQTSAPTPVLVAAPPPQPAIAMDPRLFRLLVAGGALDSSGLCHDLTHRLRFSQVEEFALFGRIDGRRIGDVSGLSLAQIPRAKRGLRRGERGGAAAAVEP